MRKKLSIALLAAGILLFFVGLALILFATSGGIAAADRALWANGGTMDTDKYYLILRSNMISYQIVGAVCSLIGGAGALLYGFRATGQLR